MSADTPQDTDEDHDPPERAEEEGGDGTTLVLAVGFLVLANVVWLSFFFL